MSPEECAVYVLTFRGQTHDRCLTEAAAHLRRLAALDHGLAWGAQHMAGRIVALEAENTRLRAALERIGGSPVPDWWARVAREALEPPVEGVPGLEGGG